MTKKRRTKTTKQVWKNKRKLQQLAKGQEMKIHDVNGGLTTVYTTPSWAFLTDIDQFQSTDDSAYSKRDGNSILARKIKIRGYINNNNGTPADGIMRILVIRYRDQLSHDLTTTNVLRNFDITTPTTSVNSFLNVEWAQHFDIIADTTFGYDTTQYSQIPFKITKKLNSEIEWQDKTGPVSTCQKNGIFLYAITNQATEANSPSIVFESRLSYVDG